MADCGIMFHVLKDVLVYPAFAQSCSEKSFKWCQHPDQVNKRQIITLFMVDFPMSDPHFDGVQNKKINCIQFHMLHYCALSHVSKAVSVCILIMGPQCQHKWLVLSAGTWEVSQHVPGEFQDGCLLFDKQLAALHCKRLKHNRQLACSK